MADIVVNKEELEKLVVDRLTEAGLTEAVAVNVAEVLVHADVRGVHSHGVLRTEHYVKRLNEGGLNQNANYTFTATGPCSGIFDGDNGLGHDITKQAMNEAIKMAKTNGLGAVVVKNSSHCGALSYFVQQAANEGLIGMAMTHTDQIVTPFGGAKPFFGTNPIAYGFPAKKHKPVIMDMATSNVALGKILHAEAAGESIPEQWGVDENGEPTTDPSRVKALSPFAGPKGYGLGMVVDIMSGLLAGAAFGPHIKTMYGDYNQYRQLGHFVWAINPGQFTDPAEFLTQMDAMIDELHAQPAAKGFSKVMVPGEPEHLKEEQSLKEGIPVTESVYQYLNGSK
ncbi:ureidoglycolate dehydrogenase [Bacillaceae bacterium SIJ1]|uniref:ureidoglycolate dehydrogenase n=1 Tax=Litoribacterium kuwaitense TaxID=1398745 RepID=UPI0013EADDD5|nr:ureidoglycolate dehydrogenase [Litoribacterium kuwaitense]NGP44835.1 ureidoglycolate dehydrogenase [Litoribacterium kuwaitense]